MGGSFYSGPFEPCGRIFSRPAKLMGGGGGDRVAHSKPEAQFIVFDWGG
jgi:hypothetical protein